MVSHVPVPGQHAPGLSPQLGQVHLECIQYFLPTTLRTIMLRTCPLSFPAWINYHPQPLGHHYPEGRGLPGFLKIKLFLIVLNKGRII
ncbi:hypothetical protein RIR_jg33654.t1 [Rhizophagus irregularis DAOM 181602=DAOM 197198]|nr:hypothetical protein RIR_jg33654.t1 [Rhizophagus irregularis DAOM 181602=DAOM 197198]